MELQTTSGSVDVTLPVSNRSSRILLKDSGQGAVEFTLIFLLMLVVAWIPADFGLALYSGQIAQNAAREGARIAASDPGVASASCTFAAADCTTNILQETADRLKSSLISDKAISVVLDGGTGCNRMVTVTVTGNYNYFFYQLLRMFGATIPNNTPVTRSTSVRWEHQIGCQPPV